MNVEKLMNIISLDNLATTPLDPLVKVAMDPFWSSNPWNAHSAHFGGAVTALAVSEARAQVAHLIGATSNEIIFTSGATESNNLAIMGSALAAMEVGSVRRRILTSAIEHKCVLEAVRATERFGFTHDIVPVDENGIVDLNALKDLMSDDVLMVSLMAANNETGIIQPIQIVAGICDDFGSVFHTDSAQCVGKIPFNVLDNGCDMASISSHKFYGPGGVGALFISAGSPLRPKALIAGGGQELNIRSGTLPVPLIVGFGSAAELAAINMTSECARLNDMSEHFLKMLAAEGVKFRLNGGESSRLPGSLNMCVPGLDATELMSRLGSAVLISTSSACNSGELQGSYVLSAMGLSPDQVSSSFRVCFGRFNKNDEASAAASILAKAMQACQMATGDYFQ
jgi:cysteine desulfurase